jgi:hypothetical protein
LKALFNNHVLLPNHATQIEVLISLNCADFFSLYLADDADYSFGKFLEQRGELNVNTPLWQEPTAEESAAVNIPV